jgi:GR25 family glycosyltransferase involved in LPS biosynthesis
MRDLRNKRKTKRFVYTTRKKRRQSGGNNPELFTMAYVINLDLSKERLDVIMKAAEKAKLALTRFPAVKIDKSILGNDWGSALQRQGIGHLMYLDQKSNFQNAGTIGCYLSHRDLLEKISKDESNKAIGTLIFEDDALITENFLEIFKNALKDIPEDWDMCFLGKHPVSADHVKGLIHKLKDQYSPHQNSGLWAYIVKNASIKEKILPTFKIMFGGLDVHWNFFQDKFNMYLVEPKIVDVNRTISSDRAGMNVPK